MTGVVVPANKIQRIAHIISSSETSPSALFVIRPRFIDRLSIAKCGRRTRHGHNAEQLFSLGLCLRIKSRLAVDKGETNMRRPPHVGFAFIHRESTFDAKAKPERKKLLGIVPMARPSTAFGYAQAIDETWSDYKKSTGRRFARRDDMGDALDFIGWYNNTSHRRLGL